MLNLNVSIATATACHKQYCTSWDSLTLINELIWQLERWEVTGKTCSPFNSPVWPGQKSSGEWRHMVDNQGLNEVIPAISAAVPDMLELHYQVEPKVAKWYAATDITNGSPFL